MLDSKIWKIQSCEHIHVPGGLDKWDPTVQPTKKHQQCMTMNKKEMDNLLTSLDSVDLF